MKKGILITLTTLLLFAIIACQEEGLLDDNNTTETTDDTQVILAEDTCTYIDWTTSTHSKDADPDFATVFNQEEVLRFDIVIGSENWSIMQADISSLIGTSNTGPGGGPGGGIPGDMDADLDSNPIWVDCALFFEGKQWYHVGIRYKGNSSLKSAYQSGNNKLSFKLDFDEFEDYYSDIENQRFYGFKQLNLNNNFDDASLMREKVGADLFRQFGLASANTSFCVVYIDHGTGPQYYGVYALVEEVDNTVIKTQFINNDGNLYKPDGDAASFAAGSYDSDEMELKTNEDIADYSDVYSLYELINNSERTSDPETWKTSLESIFEVDNFLKWLAANTVIQNWDTYGRMTHNYYLYNDPETELLTWIPWDNNEAFQFGKQGGALSLDFDDIGSSWPLIRYIINQQEYEEIYEAYLQEFIDEVFIPGEMDLVYSEYYDLIKEYAYAEESGYTFIRSDSEFDNAVEELKSHVTERNAAIEAYLE